MAERLLDDFPAVSKQEWLEKLQRDLKGKPYERLIRNSESGIPISPVYTAEDLPADVSNSYPGQDDHRRCAIAFGGRSTWVIGRDFAFADLENFEAFQQQFLSLDVDAAMRGMRIVLSAPLREGWGRNPEATKPVGLHLDDWAQLAPVIQWARENHVYLYLELGNAGLDLLGNDLLKNFSGTVDFNPLLLGKDGQPDEALLDTLLPKFAADIQDQPIRPSDAGLRLFNLLLGPYELAGANGAQQIAFALGMASDLAARFGKLGISPQKVFSNIGVQFPIGTDFFAEIGKLRAFRILWHRMCEAWGIVGECVCPVQGIPASSQETVADPHVNLLRHTTEAMAAALGGCDMISLPAYNAAFAASDLDGLRIARNIQVILQEESHIGKVMDAAGGAYFVEYLTDALAEKAWSQFQAIEADGGWYAFQGNGHLGALLAAGQAKRQTAVHTGQKTILGTNQYPNENEKLAEAQSLASSTDSAIAKRLQALQTELQISDLLPHGQRLASAFEALRLRMQALVQAQPDCNRALLLTMGDPMMRAARATFSRNVLAAGGFQCTENNSPTDLAASIAFAQTLQPSVIVLCAADPDYFEQGPDWIDAIRSDLPHAQLFLAGKPEGWEILKNNGIAESLFAGMDRVAFLHRLLEGLNSGKENKA